MAASHPLKSTWHLWYIPAVSFDVVQKTYNGDYSAAAAATTKDIAQIKTIEELWSAFNVMPPPRLLPVNDTVALLRGTKKPTFEDFPGGGRITLTCIPELADKLVERMLIAVIGQQTELALTDVEDEEEREIVCSAVRIARRKKKTEDNLRVEVWLTSTSKANELKTYFEKILQEDNVGGVQASVDAFDAATK